MCSSDRLVRRLAGVSLNAPEEAGDLGREILEVVSEGEVRGVVDEVEKDMITSVIELRETVVAEIMTPRTEMVALEKGASLEQARRLIAAEGHSRIPVYDGTVDHVLGILYAKDILSLDEDAPFRAPEIMRQAFFIPETKPLKELLHEFRRAKVHMAIVLDEYGGTSGLVTIEDILEEVVGEIADEYEPEEPAALQRVDEHTLQVDARMTIYELNKELPVPLPESDNYETLGGFVLTSLGMVPQAGTRLEHDGMELHVTEAEPRRIKRVVIRLPKVATAAE